MNRIMFFVDGFNLYHSLDDVRSYHKYKWLDISKLCACLCSSRNDRIVEVKYFTAYATWKPDSMRRHQVYIKALVSSGVQVVLGKFKRKEQYCPLCNNIFRKHEEKMTDVNIAISLLENAMLDKYDTAIIVSADSDLVPSVCASKRNFPGKRYGILIPVGRRSEELKNTVDFHMKIKEKHLATSQLPDTINLVTGGSVQKPSLWS